MVVGSRPKAWSMRYSALTPSSSQKQVFVERRDAHQIVDAVFLEAGCHAGTDAPDIGDGTMGPDFLAKGLVFEYADAAGYVLGGDIECNLGLE